MKCFTILGTTTTIQDNKDTLVEKQTMFERAIQILLSSLLCYKKKIYHAGTPVVITNPHTGTNQKNLQSTTAYIQQRLHLENNIPSPSVPGFQITPQLCTPHQKQTPRCSTDIKWDTDLP